MSAIIFGSTLARCVCALMPRVVDTSLLLLTERVSEFKGGVDDAGLFSTRVRKMNACCTTRAYI